MENIFDNDLQNEKANKYNSEYEEEIQDEFNEKKINNKNEKKKIKNIKDLLEDKLIYQNSDAITLMNLVIYFFMSFDNNREKKLYEKIHQFKKFRNNNLEENKIILKSQFNDFFKYKTNKEINNLIIFFCDNYCLNNKKFKEMLDLLEQLTRISNQIFYKKTDIDIIYDKDIKDETKNLFQIDYKQIKLPTKEEQITLSQIILSGYLDNISRKKIIYDKLSNEKEITTQKRLIYESNENNEEINIHPFSVCYRNNLKSSNLGGNLTSPELIIYKEIISENKFFMNINTIIKPEWLYDIGGDLVKYNLNLSNLLSEPYYDDKNDTIYCYVNIKYGYKSWEIPNVLVEMSKADDNYLRYFAKMLLEGKIFELMKV